MKKSIISVLGIVLLSSWAASAFARAGYTFFHPKGSFAIEVSLENPPDNLKRLPIYQNSISSLVVSGDHIIGGTSAKSGLSPYIFVASISKRKLTHKLALDEVIAGQRSVQSGFCLGQDNVVYAGTLADKGHNASGHLIKINVSSSGAIHVKDMGKPIPGDGVFALTCNKKGTMLYGMSYPSGIFFKYNIKTGDTQTYHDTAPSEKEKHTYHEFALKPKDYLSRALTVDNQGRVYGSEPINKLFYFNPKTNSIHVLKDHIPFVWGRHVLGRVDSWAKSKNGILYGGNAGDGQLFRLNTSSDKVTNLGKPIMMNRLKALAFGKNGRLYGVAGASPGYAHLFYYDADGQGFYDLGNPQFHMVAPGIKEGIAWRGFQLATMAASQNGKYIVMGEDESLSQLMVFPVPEK